MVAYDSQKCLRCTKPYTVCRCPEGPAVAKMLGVLINFKELRAISKDGP